MLPSLWWKPKLRKKKCLRKKKVKFIFIFEIRFLVLFLIILFIVICLFKNNNCVGSIVDSFLHTHAPKIICNFHDVVHVHSKFYDENDISAQGHIVVNNNYVWTNVVAFGVFDRDVVHASYFVPLFSWARLLLMFILLQPNLMLVVFFYK